MAGFEYRFGTRNPQKVALDNTAGTIAVGDAMTLTNYTSGYAGRVDALAEAVIGIAMETATAGSAHGDVSVLVDVSTQSVYEVSPDTGSMALGDEHNQCDVGANGLTIDRNGSSTDDIEIQKIDITNNRAYVRLLRTALPGA